jgi:hypothetical protein
MTNRHLRRKTEVPRRLRTERLFDARCLPSGVSETHLSKRIHGSVLPGRGCGPGAPFRCTGHVPLYGPFFCEELSVPCKRAIGEIFPEVRRRRFDLTTHNLMKRSLIKLRQEELPRDSVSGKYLFPSFPTFLERLEMLRSNQGLESNDQLYGPSVRVSRSEFNENSRLAARIVNRNVYGLRSDIEVPQRYFGHFRYCNGFSILTAPYIPVGLARFLASIWVTDPHSLWLSRPETLKQCLRKVPLRLYESVGEQNDVPSGWYPESD